MSPMASVAGATSALRHASVTSARHMSSWSSLSASAAAMPTTARSLADCWASMDSTRAASDAESPVSVRYSSTVA